VLARAPARASRQRAKPGVVGALRGKGLSHSQTILPRRAAGGASGLEGTDRDSGSRFSSMRWLVRHRGWRRHFRGELEDELQQHFREANEF